MALPAALITPCLVLDSNVVLDWLVFRNPVSHALAGAITNGRASWIATEPMRDELEHVLTRCELARWQPDLALVRSAWDRWATLVPVPIGDTAQGLHCSDPDDQKFIDLACRARASALLSRDRAVLRLAARARALGVQIVTPDRWPAPP